MATERQDGQDVALLLRSNVVRSEAHLLQTPSEVSSHQQLERDLPVNSPTHDADVSRAATVPTTTTISNNDHKQESKVRELMTLSTSPRLV